MILNLTATGKKKARDIQGKGIEQSVLASIDENGPASLEELSRDVNTDMGTMKNVAIKLANSGFIRKED